MSLETIERKLNEIIKKLDKERKIEIIPCNDVKEMITEAIIDSANIGELRNEILQLSKHYNEVLDSVTKLRQMLSAINLEIIMNKLNEIENRIITFENRLVKIESSINNLISSLSSETETEAEESEEQ